MSSPRASAAERLTVTCTAPNYGRLVVASYSAALSAAEGANNEVAVWLNRSP